METKLFSLVAAAAALCVTGCKDDDAPSTIPTVPTTLSLEDGAEVHDLKVTLSASGSSVEDKNLNVSYTYYVGKSADALEPTSAEVSLEPYTQYFWCAQAKTEVGEGELTDVRTFYCVPNFTVSTDNGDGLWAAIIRWSDADKFQSVTVSATADHEGYELESQTLEGGQDTCYFKIKYDQSDRTKNNAHTHYWDDEHGIYYEPVIYTFNVAAKVQVGDKNFTLTNTAKEIILDKQSCVRDHEFNVYRVVTIGSQTWLADDLRAKSYINDKGEIVPLVEGEEYIISTLKSGATGVLYNMSNIYCGLWKGIIMPQGCSIPTDEDFLALENEYGLSSDNILPYRIPSCPLGSILLFSEPGSYNFDFFEGASAEILLKMACKYDWEEVDVVSQNLFNAKPFGGGYDQTTVQKTQGKYACYATQSYFANVHHDLYFRVLANPNKGICRCALVVNQLDNNFASVRPIKK